VAKNQWPPNQLFVVSIRREFLFLLSTPKVALTNPKCVVKPEIVCDRQPASIKFALIDSAQGEDSYWAYA